VFSTR